MAKLLLTLRRLVPVLWGVDTQCSRQVCFLWMLLWLLLLWRWLLQWVLLW